MKFVLRLLAAAGLAMSLLAANVGTAAADSRTWSDSREARLDLDIRKVRLDNNRNNVVVVLTLRDFSWSQAERGGVSVWFDTNRSRPGPEFVAGGSVSREREWTFSRARGWNYGSMVNYCRSELTPNPRTNTIRWTLGRNCMEDRGPLRISAELNRYNRSYSRLVTDYSPTRHRFHSLVRRG